MTFLEVFSLKREIFIRDVQCYTIVGLNNLEKMSAGEVGIWYLSMVKRIPLFACSYVPQIKPIML